MECCRLRRFVDEPSELLVENLLRKQWTAHLIDLQKDTMEDWGLENYDLYVWVNPNKLWTTSSSPAHITVYSTGIWTYESWMTTRENG